MSISVVIQRPGAPRGLPTNVQITRWLAHAVGQERSGASLTVRIVDRQEAAALNVRWRGKAGPTNVLSFPMTGLAAIAPELLGDIVLCAPVLKAEAKAQHKTIAAHCAHLLVHGALHLLGYDHEQDDEAARMEARERQLLAQLAFSDPYLERSTR